MQNSNQMNELHMVEYRLSGMPGMECNSLCILRFAPHRLKQRIARVLAVAVNRGPFPVLHARR